MDKIKCITYRKKANDVCYFCGLPICDTCKPKGDKWCPNFKQEESYESRWERLAYVACSIRCIMRMNQFEVIMPLSQLHDRYDTPDKICKLIVELDRQLDTA